MGARPLRRAIQHYIEDPLADFVLRSAVPAGSTVVVDPSPEGSEPGDEVRLTVVKPKKTKTPVGVGAGAGQESSEGGGEDDAPEGGVEDGPAPPEATEAEEK
jgi:ATP-dependent Clp protease ATP-binding subunit ClpC